ncbi:MAG TPA: HAD family phosphatase [Ornithinimicrobium sp.]|uniref:HAD family hydrolase n=1 Tax=Ornithinimicrobium sp. TaxID=1977084 RepID=UPI002B488512|nr:HAD family phosphatase [Ornithinimicrobium sp.]HKJ12514.1 HAD family phosphatase [Ornithinimicrobium sp.]
MTTPIFPAAVLWDMDGTILDTEPYWMAEETRLVEEAGGTWSTQEASELVGSDLNHSAQALLERTPVSGSSDEIVNALLDGVVRQVREEIPWRPGARELIAELAEAEVPMALVTMSWQPLAEVLLEALPPSTFAAVVTGDQVSDGKPHPEPYLTACRRLQVEPADCLAIEDSPTGVRAALAAGVRTLAVSHMVQVDEDLPATRRHSLEGLGLADLRRLFG